MAPLNKRRKRLIRLADIPDLNKGKRRRLVQLGDVPDLVHLIQLALPPEDAVRTCILSKSWLHAWSATPAIRFSPSVDSLRKKNQRKYMRWIHRTLLGYRRDSLPLTTLDLQFGIHTALRSAYKLIMQATSISLHELHLAILSTTSFTLPDEIFSSENLHTLCLKLISRVRSLLVFPRYSLRFTIDPSIHCTNLRVLKLYDVHLTHYTLDTLLSTCKLLQRIDIELPVELNTIEVNNLRYLEEFRILNLCEWDNIFEVDDVPSLRSLVYITFPSLLCRPVLFKLGTIHTLRELTLYNVSLDDAFSSMIKTNFPFLESLTLVINSCSVEILDIRCLTLQRLMLRFVDLDNEIKVQVYAPNLLFYSHKSTAPPPSLLFPAIPPQQIELFLQLNDPVDEYFFLNMREALELSSKFSITIYSAFGVLVPFDIDDVRTILPFPSTSVEELVFIKHFDSALWENSLLFDAVFSICHPLYVKANDESNLKVANYLLNQLMVHDNGIGQLEYCEIRNPRNGRWVALTSYSLSLLDATTLRDCSDSLKLTEFKLTWCSP